MAPLLLQQLIAAPPQHQPRVGYAIILAVAASVKLGPAMAHQSLATLPPLSLLLEQVGPQLNEKLPGIICDQLSLVSPASPSGRAGTVQHLDDLMAEVFVLLQHSQELFISVIQQLSAPIQNGTASSRDSRDLQVLVWLHCCGHMQYNERPTF